MKQVLTFLNELQKNNSKEWFDAHRSHYESVRLKFSSFVQQLIDGLSVLDPSVRGLRVQDCMFRLNRDLRFSPDKRPYKTHMSAFIAPFGRKSGYAGYYFHLEASDGRYLMGHQLDSGIYGPDPAILKSVREAILMDGAGFEAVVHKAGGFQLETEVSLKRVPRGFPVDSPWAEYLKMRHFILNKPLREEAVLADDLLEQTMTSFAKTVEFNNWLNKAVAYAR